MYRRSGMELEVLLVHPGGPFFAKKDEGAWSIPKGLVKGDEDLLEAAQREFQEETGFDATGPFIQLGSVNLKSRKAVHAWAFEGDCDPSQLSSNTFVMEWPPQTGQQQSFPEVDRCAFFPIDEAMRMLNQGQRSFLERLSKLLG